MIDPITTTIRRPEMDHHDAGAVKRYLGEHGVDVDVAVGTDYRVLIFSDDPIDEVAVGSLIDDHIIIERNKRAEVEMALGHAIRDLEAIWAKDRKNRTPTEATLLGIALAIPRLKAFVIGE